MNNNDLTLKQRMHNWKETVFRKATKKNTMRMHCFATITVSSFSSPFSKQKKIAVGCFCWKHTKNQIIMHSQFSECVSIVDNVTLRYLLKVSWHFFHNTTFCLRIFHIWINRQKIVFCCIFVICIARQAWVKLNKKQKSGEYWNLKIAVPRTEYAN